MEDGQYEIAIQEFNKAIQLDWGLAVAYEWRGNSYRTLGQYTLADADEATACSLDNKYC